MPTVFLYGTSLPGKPEHRWIAGLPTTPATVRGTLWRSPRNRPGLAPHVDGKPIRGVLVEVDDARLRVLDLVESAGGGEVRRARVDASAHMRSVPAEAWIVDPEEVRRLGWRPTLGTEWARGAP